MMSVRARIRSVPDPIAPVANHATSVPSSYQSVIDALAFVARMPPFATLLGAFVRMTRWPVAGTIPSVADRDRSVAPSIAVKSLRDTRVGVLA
jgi:hypothetical protein